MGKFNGAETKVMTGRVTLSISFTSNTRQVLPKLQSIIEFLSLNLSDLYNKISLFNISDSSAAKRHHTKGILVKTLFSQKHLWGQAVVMCLLVRCPTKGNIYYQLGQCINKGKLSPLPLGRQFKSAKDIYFSSSMCCLAICLELLWIFQIKQSVPIVHNLVWAPL